MTLLPTLNSDQPCYGLKTPLKSDSPILEGPLPVLSPEPKAQAVSTKPCCFSSLSWFSTLCDPHPISTELATALTWSLGTADLLSRYTQTTHSYLVLFSWNILSDPQLQMFLDSGNLRQAVSPRTNQNLPPETVSRSDFSGCLISIPRGHTPACWLLCSKAQCSPD